MTATAASVYEDREATILQAAAKCIEATSLLDFTMSAISTEAGLSMGTIYKHIQSKEDVLLALGRNSQLHFQGLARKVMAMPLPIAARLVAVQMIDDEHASPYSFGSELTTLLANEAILRRASPGWLDKYIAADIAVDDFFSEQIEKACEDGELSLDNTLKSTQVDELSRATWALCIGHLQVVRQRSVRALAARPTRLERDSTIVRTLQRLLNTYPLSTSLTDELIAETCKMLADAGLRKNRIRGIES